MPNYQNGRVYMIVSPSHPEIPPYYGSTVRTLAQRMVIHRSKCNTTGSRLIIECGDAIIVLVEEVKCNSKEELRAREAFYILNNDCINKQIPLRTKKEYAEMNKDKRREYEKNKSEEKKEEKRAYVRNYHDEHKNDEEYIKKRKEYQDRHKNEKKEYDEKYREERKEKIYEKKMCDVCGGSYSLNSKSNHYKTKKHLASVPST